MSQTDRADFVTDRLLSARHGFFGRRGGVSGGFYESLQTGYGAKADTPENVTENRRRVTAALGVAPDRLVTGWQSHSADVRVVDAPWTPDEAPRVDALATRTRGIALGVLAADCAPVLLEDQDAGVVGAAHAGWRGALGGVLEAVVDAMEGLGAQRRQIVAAIGPCISPVVYEIGPEFLERFCAADPENARFFEPGEDDRHLFNLPGYACARLAAAGVREARWSGRCSYQEADRFFSHRRSVHRGDDDYGRQISVIVAP